MNKQKIIKELLPQLLEQGSCDGYIEDRKSFMLKKGPHFGSWGGKIIVIELKKTEKSTEQLTLDTNEFIPSINNDVIIHVEDDEVKFWIIPFEYKL